MKLRNMRALTVIATLLIGVRSFYAQEHSAKRSHSGADAPEIFCGHKGTGQLCSGNASMFKLSEAQKQRYLEAVSIYNKAVASASKQFLGDLKDKVGLSESELALAQSWFAEGLNPEINKILAAKAKK